MEWSKILTFAFFSALLFLHTEREKNSRLFLSSSKFLSSLSTEKKQNKIQHQMKTFFPNCLTHRVMTELFKQLFFSSFSSRFHFHSKATFNAKKKKRHLRLTRRNEFVEQNHDGIVSFASERQALFFSSPVIITTAKGRK